GSIVPVLTTTSGNSVTGIWSPSVVDNQANGTYTFTPDAGQCASSTTFTLEVNAIPIVTARSDTSVYDGAVLPGVNCITTPGAITNWVNSNSSIGLPAWGRGNIPSFIAVNRTN